MEDTNNKIIEELDYIFDSANCFIGFLQLILKNNDGAIIILEGDIFVNIYPSYKLKYIRNKLVVCDENDTLIKMLDISKIIYLERLLYEKV